MRYQIIEYAYIYSGFMPRPAAAAGKNSCQHAPDCDNSVAIHTTQSIIENLFMKALTQVISLVVISVVVIIIPPCGAALGRRTA
ncbi:ilv operon leader peptide [Martelella alba]